jgi:RNA-directed DNA polymerase
MRAIILRQKKRPRHLYRFLVRHGLSRKAAAATAFGYRGYWARSKAPGLERVLGTAWFHERLLSLEAE